MSASLKAFGFANVTDADFDALVDFLMEQKYIPITVHDLWLIR